MLARVRKNKKVTDEDIANIEKKYNLKLPEDYKEYLLKYNGIAAGKNWLGDDYAEDGNRIEIYIPILDERAEISVRCLFNCNGCDVKKSTNLHTYMDMFGDELPEGAILIGDSDEAGFFGLDTSEEHYGVFFWDDQRRLSFSTDEMNAYHIAESFTDFLEKVGGLHIVEEDRSIFDSILKKKSPPGAAIAAAPFLHPAD